MGRYVVRGVRGIVALAVIVASVAGGRAQEPPPVDDGLLPILGSGKGGRQLMINGIPAKYWEMTNPVAATTDNVRRGAELYAALCAVCHGATGLGDGLGGEAMETSPATLVYTMGAPYASDPFLYWSIAEGGVALNTEMPAYEDVLEGDEIWQVILYMRAGFPGGLS